jgi:hypothetical protein
MQNRRQASDDEEFTLLQAVPFCPALAASRAARTFCSLATAPYAPKRLERDQDRSRQADRRSSARRGALPEVLVWYLADGVAEALITDLSRIGSHPRAVA